MKKILLVAGVIGCCVLLLGGYLIINEFGGFAYFLGDKSKKIYDDQNVNFIGSWNIENSEEKLIFSSAGEVSGYYDGDYEIVEKILYINLSLNDISYEYNYYFSNNYGALILSEIDTGIGLYLYKT